MKILSFGEILFDVFDGEYKMGGAPLNFCAHIAKLGASGYIVSAVGCDELGKCAVDIIKSYGVKTDFVECNEKPTGVCMVSCDNGEPVYDLVRNVAYDFIEAVDLDKIKEKEFDVFYFGTLAQREEKSRKALYKILNHIKFKKVFFDVNLRQNYYSADMIKKGISYADIVKINRDEFLIIKKIFECNTDDEKFIEKLCSEYKITTLILTLDKDGVIVYDINSGFIAEKQTPSELVSAVGAGDSFCACYVYNYMNGEEHRTCARRSNILAGYVVGFDEAIPKYSEELIKKLDRCL